MTWMQPAEKTDKRAAIDLVNSDLRTGRVLVCHEARPLADEWQLLPWADDKREREHQAYPNHCADAALYGWRAHRAWSHQAPRQRAVHAPDSQDRIDAEIAAFQRRRNRPAWDDE
jgi:hypothetical protein